jgi:putative FmdB family regulatory protein
MPIYEYQCAACGRLVEKWQKMSEKPLTTCPDCGGRLTKVISNCAFHLKGGGWYVTDYGASRQGVSGGDKAEDSPAPPPPAPAREKSQKAAAPESSPAKIK